MFKWKEAYCCHIPEIDAQHEKLFQLGGALYEIVSLEDGFDHYDEIMAILQELKDYTVYHFGYEEKLLQQYGYDTLEFKMHRLEHKAFLNKVLSIHPEEVDEQQRKILLEILAFVADWIEKHILQTDRKYQNFLQKQHEAS